MVYIYSVDLIVQVYLEADLIYQYGAFGQDGRGRFEGWPWHLIELPEDFGNHRSHFEELLIHESAWARRERTPLALVMLDIDHFKQLNDRHGHETGDAVLASVGALLREHFRDAYVVCRLGGEEFVVVLPGATAQRAEARIQALLHAIRSNRFRHHDTPLDEVTLSCGVAAYPQHTYDPAELVTLADQALYRAKPAGRDRSENYVASVAG